MTMIWRPLYIEGDDGTRVVIHSQDHRANEAIAGDDWEPGDPLYATSGNYSRELFQIVPIGEACWWGYYWCHDCDVLWWPWDEDGNHAVGPACWMCGKDAAHPEDSKEEHRRSVASTNSTRRW